MTSALAGLKAVAFTHFAAGPLVAQYLGALGADVVKVEAPGRGDYNRFANQDPGGKLNGLSPYFLGLNRNQRGIVLDLKTQSGQEAAKRLVQQADILVENYRPGVLDRLGLGYDVVSETNPRIIYCSISAYDPIGPSRNEPGQDILIQGLSGLASLSGPSDMPPIAAGGYIIDSYSGMQGVIGVLAALLYRNMTGQGQWVRADMISAALHMLSSETAYVLNIGSHYERSSSPGVAHVYQAAPYGTYKTLDGAIIISGTPYPDLIRRVLDDLGTLEQVESYLTVDGLRTHRNKIAEAFTKGISKLASKEAMDIVSAAGIWVVPVRTLSEAFEDPAVIAAEVVREINGSFAGPHKAVVEPIKLGKSPIIADRGAPGHGEHTIEVLNEIGFSVEEIRQMIKSGAVSDMAAKAEPDANRK